MSSILWFTILAAVINKPLNLHALTQYNFITQSLKIQWVRIGKNYAVIQERGLTRALSSSARSF